MSQPTTNDSAAPINATMEIPTDIKRHPFRGFLWGLILGLGVAILLIVTKLITLAIAPIVTVIIVVALLATIWGLVGPAKQAKGPIPVQITPSPAPPQSRFDDFADSPTAPVQPIDAPAEVPGEIAADEAPQPDTSVFDAPPAGAASTDPAEPADSDDD